MAEVQDAWPEDATAENHENHHKIGHRIATE